MRKPSLVFIPAIAFLAITNLVAEETATTTVSTDIAAGVSTKAETTVDGKKVTETNTGSLSTHDEKTQSQNGDTTTTHGNELGFEHKTETEISKGDHHEVKVDEKDAVKVSSDVSNDGKNGDTSTVGVSYSKGYDASAEAHAGADGKYAGGNAEADASAHAGMDAGAQWSVGPDGIVGTADVKFGVGADAHAGADGRLGTEDNNVHGEAEVKISAELAAELKAQIKANEEGVGVEGEAKIGGSVSAEGTIKGGITIWGIPFDVSVTGGVSAGAEASAKGGIMYDAETGTLTLELGASAVVGVGGSVGTTVEIGVGQLFGKILDLLFGDDDDDGDKEGPGNNESSQGASGGQDGSGGGPGEGGGGGGDGGSSGTAGGNGSSKDASGGQDGSGGGSDDYNGGGESEDDGGGFWAGVGDFFSGAWDYIAWQTYGASKMKKLLDRVGQLYSMPLPVPPEGCCICVANAYANVRNQLAKDWQRWQRAYSAVNGWAAVAYTCKSFGEAMQVAFKTYDRFFTADKQGIAGTVLEKLNAYEIARADNGGNVGGAIEDAFVGKAEQLVKNLCKFLTMSWKDCKTTEDKIAYLQLVVDIHDGLRQAGDVNALLRKIGLGSEYLDIINEGLKALSSDIVADGAQSALDAMRAAVEYSRYFANVSEAMEVLDEMTIKVPAYEDVLARYREQVAKGVCICKSGCQCDEHCREHEDDGGHDHDGDNPGGTNGTVIVIIPIEPGDPWSGPGSPGYGAPGDIIVIPGYEGGDGNDVGDIDNLLSDIGRLIDGIGGGTVSPGSGIGIPDFGISGSDNPVVPDGIGDSGVSITVSGILNTANINAGKGNASIIVNGGKGDAAPKRKVEDMGGKGRSTIWSNRQ